MNALALDRELRRELAPMHRLRAVSATAIHRESGRDDVAYLCSDGTVAQVHLTYRRERVDQWPSAQYYPTLDDYIAALAPHATTTPCLTCGGECGAVWYRAPIDSDDYGTDIWIGKCRATPAGGSAP